MRRRPPPLALDGLYWLVLACLFCPLAQAISIFTPSSTTVWVQGGSSNIVRWSLYPVTFPTPRRQWIDAYIYNGSPSMYNPPLNRSILQGFDVVYTSAFAFEDAEDLKTGMGYQILFVDPDDASIIHGESDEFTVASEVYGSVFTSTTYDGDASVTAGFSSSSPSTMGNATVTQPSSLVVSSNSTSESVTSASSLTFSSESSPSSSQAVVVQTFTTTVATKTKTVTPTETCTSSHASTPSSSSSSSEPSSTASSESDDNNNALVGSNNNPGGSGDQGVGNDVNDVFGASGALSVSAAMVMMALTLSIVTTF